MGNMRQSTFAFCNDFGGFQGAQEGRHGPQFVAWVLGQGLGIIVQGRAAGCLAGVAHSGGRGIACQIPGKKKAGIAPAVSVRSVNYPLIAIPSMKTSDISVIDPLMADHHGP